MIKKGDDIFEKMNKKNETHMNWIKQINKNKIRMSEIGSKKDELFNQKATMIINLV